MPKKEETKGLYILGCNYWCRWASKHTGAGSGPQAIPDPIVCTIHHYTHYSNISIMHIGTFSVEGRFMWLPWSLATDHWPGTFTPAYWPAALMISTMIGLFCGALIPVKFIHEPLEMTGQSWKIHSRLEILPHRSWQSKMHVLYDKV